MNNWYVQLGLAIAIAVGILIWIWIMYLTGGAEMDLP